MGYDRQADIDVFASRWFMNSAYGKSWGEPETLHAYLLASGEINSGNITYQSAEVGLGRLSLM